MTYKWKLYQYPVSAQTVGVACERIQQRDGTVTRAALVEEARDTNSELHPLFTWDNNVAADKWREHEAGSVLSNLHITISEKGGKPQTVKAFISVAHNAPNVKARYLDVATAMSIPDTRETVLSNALRELEAVRSKYNTLSELQPVWDAVEGIGA